jgi:BMFP domain-containing protein YqiC
MQTSNRFFDDFAKMASGALHTLGGLREEIETRVRERVERWAADMDLVTREEFDAVSAMAAKAREEQERIASRLAVLEAELAGLKGQAGTAAPAGGEAAGADAAAKPARTRTRKKATGSSDPDVEAGAP